MGITRILITISRSDISMAYATGDENALPVSLPEGNWPLPLARFGGVRAEYPTFLIGKGVEEKLQEFYPPQTPGENIFKSIPKSELPIVVIAENDVPDSGLTDIVADLRKWGFETVRTVRPDVLVIDYYNAHYPYDGVVVVSANLRDVAVSLFKRNEEAKVVRRSFDGRAIDNRIGSVAEKIWEQVKDLTFDLRFETERDALLAEAEKFLKEGRREKSGQIRLSDNDTYLYVLTRDMLSDIPVAADSIESAYTDFLQANGLADRNNLAVVVRNQAIGNRYVSDAVTKFFGSKAEDKGSLADALARRIANLPWDAITDDIDRSLIEKKTTGGQTEGNDTGGGKTGGGKEGGGGNTGGDQTGGGNKGGGTGGKKPIEEKPIEGPKEFIPVEVNARIDSEKVSLFKRKYVLHINIDLELGTALPWDSVLCVQEDPLLVVDPRFVVRTYEKGRRGPFALDLDLPLPQCPKAKKLRVYFKPHPDEPVNINNAYVQDPVIVEVK